MASSATTKPPPEVKPLTDVIAGAIARAGSQACIHPLDTLKVRMQAGKQHHVPYPTERVGILKLPRPIAYAFSLYKGCTEAAFGAGIIIGSYFAFYSSAKLLLHQHTDLPQGTAAFLSGGIAAVGSSIVKVPIAVCIRSVQAGNYRNAAQAARGITRKAGLGGMYSGLAPTLLEDIPDSAVKFAMYETLRSTHKLLTNRPANAAEDLLMGGTAGAVAAAASTPLDVLKTRMQVNAAVRPKMVEAARSVWREAGARGFFYGVGPRVLSNGINSAIFFSFFEAIRGFMSASNLGGSVDGGSGSGRGQRGGSDAGVAASRGAASGRAGPSATAAAAQPQAAQASRHASIGLSLAASLSAGEAAAPRGDAGASSGSSARLASLTLSGGGRGLWGRGPRGGDADCTGTGASPSSGLGERPWWMLSLGPLPSAAETVVRQVSGSSGPGGVACTWAPTL